MTNLIYSYVRVSTQGQDLINQKDQIKQYAKIHFPGQPITFFEEKVSAVKEKIEFEKLKSYLRAGDTLIVHSLSRLGHRLVDLIETMKFFEEKNVKLHFVTEKIDTSTPGGRFIFHIFASLTQLEVELLRQRTKNALETKRQRGIKGGRKPKDPKILADVLRAYNANQEPISHILERHKVSKTCFYKYLRKQKALQDTPNTNQDVTQ